MKNNDFKNEEIVSTWRKRDKRIYSISESIRALYLALISFPFFIIAKLNKLFIERIMIAVTQVNGCPMCSYEHCKIALKNGMSPEEIKNLLSGSYSHVPNNELTAILFAEHYADTRGHPSIESINKLFTTYGNKEANGIIAAIRIITMGNSYGIPLGALLGRFSNKKDYRTSLFYEVGQLLTFGILFIPLSIYSLLTFIFRKNTI